MLASTNNRRIGVILAAGRGRRMGCTKQLVLWKGASGQKPLVTSAYDAIVEVCDEMVVVVGHDADAVAAALADRPFVKVQSDPDADMFQSVRAGLDAAHAADPPATIVLQPGDHPEVAAATLLKLLNAAEQNLEKAVMPEYQGRGGHPVLIPPAIVKMLRSADCRAGLGAFWCDHPDLRIRLPVDDPTVCYDVDTAERLRQ